MKYRPVPRFCKALLLLYGFIMCIIVRQMMKDTDILNGYLDQQNHALLTSEKDKTIEIVDTGRHNVHLQDVFNGDDEIHVDFQTLKKVRTNEFKNVSLLTNLLPKISLENAIKQRNMHKPKLVVWTQDYDNELIIELKAYLLDYGVDIIENSLAQDCSRTASCADNLKVINQINGRQQPSEQLLQQFYETYKDSEEFQNVDAFLCIHPPAMCQLLIRFNKPIVLIIDGRYEENRISTDAWNMWNSNIKTISLDRKNFIFSTNQYDANYVKFYTKVEPTVLPLFCNYLTLSYSPEKSDYLLMPIKKHEFASWFCNSLLRESKTAGKHVKFSLLSDLYRDYNERDLIKHPGIIHIPHGVSYRSFTEHYRLNIPIFVPGLELWVKWHLEFNIIQDRTYNEQRNKLGIQKRPKPLLHLPDPNEDTVDWALGYWLQYSDAQLWPHVTYFDSLEHLVSLMEDVSHGRLILTSKEMKQHNDKMTRRFRNIWNATLSKLLQK